MFIPRQLQHILNNILKSYVISILQQWFLKYIWDVWKLFMVEALIVGTLKEKIKLGLSPKFHNNKHSLDTY